MKQNFHLRFTSYIFLIVFVIVSQGYVSTLKWNIQKSQLSSTSATNSELESSAGNPRIRSAEWARLRGMEPGYGGIWPGDPNAQKYEVKIISKKTGEEFKLMVPADRYIYHYFEENDIDLPIHNKQRMCRQGCCTICSLKIESGTVKMDNPLGLLKEMRQNGYALSCCAYPKSDIVCTLQDEDEVYIKQWAESFESGGVEWGGVLLDED